MEDVKKLLNEIFETTITINTETEHDAFLNLHSHVNQIEVRFFKNGWNEFEECKVLKAYYDDGNYKMSVTEALKNIIKNLREWSGLNE